MNFEKLFKTIEALITVRDIAMDKPAPPPDAPVAEASKSGLAGQIETRLTNVLVAALKEAFDRDHARLELERAHIEDQRRRAEEALQLELRRQAADRELGRLRLITAAALVGWIVTIVLLVTRNGQVPPAAMAILATGCLLLLASLGAAFTAQKRVSGYVPEGNRLPTSGPGRSDGLGLLAA